MMGHHIRSMGTTLLALLGTALLGGAVALATPVAAGPRSVWAEVVLAGLGDPGPALDDGGIAYIMGGSGLPNPQAPYVADLFDHYVASAHGGAYSGFTPQGFNTAEGLYPYTGVKDLPLDESVKRGLEAMTGDYSQIMNSINGDSNVTVVGYSQSAILSSLFMQEMHEQNVSPDKLGFVLLGDPMNPNGGLLSRFAGLNIPSLGLNFYGATPADLYPTDIYTLEYDGFADFPRYPLNLLSDLNAFAGIYYVHGTYPDLDPAALPDGYGLHQLATASDSITNYYMISIPNLPLLEPIRSIPLVGNPIADLVQPDLAALINLGYGDPAFGWSTAPANLATPFGILPPLSAFEKLPGVLVDGTQKGLADFVGDIVGGGPNPVSLSDLNPLDLLSGAGGAAGTDPLGSVASFLPNAVNALSDAAANAYAALLPTADIGNALVTSIPAYLLNLSLDNLMDGDLLNAVGLPLAGAVGLATMAGGFEFLVIADAAQAVLGDLTGLIGI